MEVILGVVLEVILGVALEVILGGWDGGCGAVIGSNGGGFVVIVAAVGEKENEWGGKSESIKRGCREGGEQ